MLTEDGKTMEEEACDSARMLGCVLLFAVPVLIAAAFIAVVLLLRRL
jgi:hypothetical protein